MGQRYDVLVSRQNGEKRFFTKIGAAFVNQDGSIGVKLDALPLTGDLFLKIPLPRDGENAGGGGGGGQQQRRRRPGQPQRIQQSLPNYPKSTDEAFGNDTTEPLDDVGAFPEET